MDEPSSWLSITAIVAAIAVYLASLAFYRLFLHPLSRFPGPKLAAVTRYYEGYFDVYRNGEYTFRIAEMHKKYGLIVRISPYELHVSDPTFFETLYHQDKALDKYAWAVDAWGVKGGAFATSAHHVHKARRQPIAPFFSQAKVASRQDLIRKHVVKLRHRLTKLAETGETFNLGAAIAALTRDVSHDFILNKDYNSLDKEDFDVVQLDFGNGSGGVWRLSKFVRFVGPMLQSLPVPLVATIADKHTKEFFRHLMNTQEDTRKLMAEATSTGTVDSKRQRNLVDEIMNSNLPPSEKEFKRVFDDITTTTGAGFETSASVLRLVVFHVYSDAKLLTRLRTELASAGATTPDHQLDWKALEQLPTLSAVLHEGLRLSPGIATRMARISPHEDIWYNNEWRIPAGTPVGMTSLLMHLDESVWPEPKRFNPDRWLENTGETSENGGMRMRKAKRGFAPFSKGTRMCVGLHLAWAEMYLTLAHLVLHFDFRFSPDGASARDFEAISDNFTVGTRGKGHLGASVKVR